MRKIINNLIYDTDKAEFIGFTVRKSGCLKETMYRNRNGRYFLVHSELDYQPVHHHIIPFSNSEFNEWMKLNQSILKRIEEEKKTPMTTTFIHLHKEIDNASDVNLLFHALNKIRYEKKNR